MLNNPHSNPLLYLRLRGVKQQELQSILQFMYLGEATILQDRINEFIAVAKDLEVKELSKEDVPEEDDVNNVDVSEVNTEDESVIDDNTSSVSDTIDELLNLDIPEFNEHDGKNILTENKSFKCQDCDLVFGSKSSLFLHTRSKHKGVTHSCDQCEFEATSQQNLHRH